MFRWGLVFRWGWCLGEELDGEERTQELKCQVDKWNIMAKIKVDADAMWSTSTSRGGLGWVGGT